MEDMPLGVQESPPPTWRTWLGNPGYQPPAPEGQSSHLENMALGIQESGSLPGGPGVTPHLEETAWGSGSQPLLCPSL